MYATLTLEPSTIKRFPGFKKRMDWFLENRTSISRRNIANMSGASPSSSSSAGSRAGRLTRPFSSSPAGGKGDRRLLALANEDRLRRILERMLDENEFLSEYGIRSCVDRPSPRLCLPLQRPSLTRPSLSLQALALPQGAPLVVERQRRGVQRPLLAGRLALGHVRRQLELARPDLARDDLPPHRVAPALLPVLRQRL